jgi:Fe2+ or Zn2+ uptake regulation protein
MSEFANDMKKALDERRRANVLKFLKKQPQYMADAEAIRLNLSMEGTAISRATLISDLIRLRDLGLVHVFADITAAKLTADGLDVADGTTTLPGVARPLPE